MVPGIVVLITHAVMSPVPLDAPELMAAGITLGGWLTLGCCQGLEKGRLSATLERGDIGR